MWMSGYSPFSAEATTFLWVDNSIAETGSLCSLQQCWMLSLGQQIMMSLPTTQTILQLAAFYPSISTYFIFCFYKFIPNTHSMFKFSIYFLFYYYFGTSLQPAFNVDKKDGLKMFSLQLEYITFAALFTKSPIYNSHIRFYCTISSFS